MVVNMFSLGLRKMFSKSGFLVRNFGKWAPKRISLGLVPEFPPILFFWNEVSDFFLVFQSYLLRWTVHGVFFRSVFGGPPSYLLTFGAWLFLLVPVFPASDFLVRILLHRKKREFSQCRFTLQVGSTYRLCCVLGISALIVVGLTKGKALKVLKGTGFGVTIFFGCLQVSWWEFHVGGWVRLRYFYRLEVAQNPGN